MNLSVSPELLYNLSLTVFHYSSIKWWQEKQVKRKGEVPLKKFKTFVGLVLEVMSKTIKMSKTCWKEKAPTNWEFIVRRTQGDVGILGFLEKIDSSLRGKGENTYSTREGYGIWYTVYVGQSQDNEIDQGQLRSD